MFLKASRAFESIGIPLLFLAGGDELFPAFRLEATDLLVRAMEENYYNSPDR